MGDKPFLLPDEIKNLTDRQQRPAQVKVLQSMNIDHKVRPDGSIAILRAHIIKIFGGDPTTKRKTNKTAEPNWEAVS
jgi:hypothetical protein